MCYQFNLNIPVLLRFVVFTWKPQSRFSTIGKFGEYFSTFYVFFKLLPLKSPNFDKKCKFVGNKAKGRISKRVFQENEARQIFRKENISYLLIRTRTLLPTSYLQDVMTRKYKKILTQKPRKTFIENFNTHNVPNIVHNNLVLTAFFFL